LFVTQLGLSGVELDLLTLELPGVGLELLAVIPLALSGVELELLVVLLLGLQL
jgi:hypothetical protein